MTSEEHPVQVNRWVIITGIAVLLGVFGFMMASGGGQIESIPLNDSEASFIQNCNQNGGTAYTNFDKNPAKVEFCLYENGTKVNATFNVNDKTKPFNGSNGGS